MFKLQEHAEFDWPVEINQPVDGGTKTVAKCTIRYRVVDQDDQDDYAERRISEQAFADKIVVGWGEDVGDERGNPLPYNNENKVILLKVPYVRSSIVLTYLKSVNGLAQAKNSKRPQDTGS